MLVEDVELDGGESRRRLWLKRMPNLVQSQIYLNYREAMLPRYLEHLLEINSMLDTCKKPPDVIFNNLKVIKVNNFRGSTSEIRLLKFLLQKAVLLQSLVIVAPPTDVKKGIEAEHTSSSSQC